MKILKKLYFMLAMILLAVSCSSCGGPGNTDGGGEKSAGTGETAAPDAPAAVADTDGLPDFDYGGAEIKILANNDITVIHDDYVIEAITGERVNDAIFNLNAQIEERFNIVFKQSGGGYTQIPDLLKKSVKAADDAYDLVTITDRYAVRLACEAKYFYYADELPYVDLGKPYWDKSLNECVSIKGKNYYALGACMLPTYDLMGFLVFNKKTHGDLGLESIYQLVKNGKWTFDRFTDMSRAATQDLNGDGKMTEDDRYGLITHSGFTYASFWCVNRAFLINKDAGDIPYFNVPGNENIFTIFNRLHEFVTSGFEYSVTRNPIKNGTNDQFDTLRMFGGGNGLFASASAFTAQSLNNMEADFGIVPYPAIDEKKPGEAYLSRLSYSMPLVVPATANPEMCSVVLEALAYAYGKNVIPEYRDVTIQVKVVRDEESSEILEMLFKNRVIDMGDSIWYEDVRQKYEIMFTKKDNAFQAMTESIQAKVENLIEKAVNSIG